MSQSSPPTSPACSKCKFPLVECPNECRCRGPTTVLVFSLCFIGIVFAMHIFGKLSR